MAVKRIEISEAKAILSDLVVLAEQGTEVILTEGGRPRAKLTPLTDESADGDLSAHLPEDALDDVGS